MRAVNWRLTQTPGTLPSRTSNLGGFGTLRDSERSVIRRARMKSDRRFRLRLFVFPFAALAFLNAPLAASPVEKAAAAAVAHPAAQGKIAWRFKVQANYISHRADIGQDGT